MATNTSRSPTDSARLAYRHLDPGGDAEVDVLFVSVPSFGRFCDESEAVFHIGLGSLVSVLRERGVRALVYNAAHPENGKRPPENETHAAFRWLGRIRRKIRRVWDSAHANASASARLEHRCRNASRIVDARIDIWEEMDYVFRLWRPKMAGISLKAPDIPVALRVCRMIRAALPETTIVIGGPAATASAEYLHAHGDFDYLVQGEGEQTVAELYDYIVAPGGKSLENIAGIAYRKNGRLIQNQRRPLIADLSALPFPDHHAMFGVVRKWGGAIDGLRRIVTASDILTSRGCPFQCKFCSAHAIWGTRRPRYVAIEKVIEEIKQLHDRYGQKFFVLWDDMFVANKARVREFCDAINREKLDIRWDCLAHAKMLNLDTLRMMKAAGCKEVQVGMESGSDRVLKLIQKNTTRAELQERTALVKAAGLNLLIFAILGFPSETEEEMLATMDFAQTLRADWVGLSFFAPQPGSQFFTEMSAVDPRMNADFHLFDTSKPCINHTRIVSDRRFYELAMAAVDYVDLYNRKRIDTNFSTYFKERIPRGR